VSEDLDPTQEMLSERVPMQFRPGKAQVPTPEERRRPTVQLPDDLPTGQIVTSGHLKRPRLPVRRRLRNLRTGGRWSLLGAAVLLVCWALWAAQSSGGGYANAVLILVLILAVAVGLFGLLRLVGGIVLERWLSRTRRSAVLSHVAIGFFLAAAGISFLPRVEWLINAWNDIRGMR
jgi:hypothetical protein